MFTRLSVSRAALLSRASLLVAVGGALCAAPQAHAQIYLVGAELFAATPTGATSNSGYLVSTNSQSVVEPLNITLNGVTQNQAISFALSNGSNALSFSEATINQYPFSSYGGSDGELGLFFSSTNTSYDPASSARTPDLLVARATNSSAAFFAPAAGTLINGYVLLEPATSNGATSFTVGNLAVRVTQYSVADDTTGTLTLRVGAAPVAVPEPGSVALLIGAGVTGTGFLARRRRNVKKAA